ncbi:MAG: hypothetical protein EP326_07520 [Deltaproteobacteria bacterium]|nr:MAG: hypothetical protein EP326_07520 [Deltaproteobacteria bacterium]
MKTTLTIFLLLATLLSSCGQDQGNSNPSLSPNQGTSGTTTGNPMTTLKLSSFAVSGHFPGELQATLCIKRLRFKRDGFFEDNVDFNIGEITLNENGKSLPAVGLPPGVYKRIEIELDDKCGNSYSVSLLNKQGSFKTTDRTSMKFFGNFNHTQSNQQITLFTQSIMQGLSTVNSDEEVKDILENVSGSL